MSDVHYNQYSTNCVMQGEYIGTIGSGEVSLVSFLSTYTSSPLVARDGHKLEPSSWPKMRATQKAPTKESAAGFAKCKWSTNSTTHVCLKSCRDRITCTVVSLSFLVDSVTVQMILAQPA